MLACCMLQLQPPTAINLDICLAQSPPYFSLIIMDHYKHFLVCELVQHINHAWPCKESSGSPVSAWLLWLPQRKRKKEKVEAMSMRRKYYRTLKQMEQRGEMTSKPTAGLAAHSDASSVASDSTAKPPARRQTTSAIPAAATAAAAPAPDNKSRQDRAPDRFTAAKSKAEAARARRTEQKAIREAIAADKKKREKQRWNVRRKYAERTSRGQPVMKHRMLDLLDKVQTRHGSK